MKTVLLTRPKGDALESEQKLRSLSFDAVNIPMTRIEAKGFDPIPDNAHLIITSRNAAKIGLKKVSNKDRKIYAVGERTAKAARELGFSNIVIGERDGAALAALIEQHHSNKTIPLIHLAGANVAFDVAGYLKEKGHRAVRVVVYEALADASLPGDILDKFKDGKISHCLFYSPRSATIFEKTFAEFGEIDWLRGVTAVSLSAQIDAALSNEWGNRKIAAHPSEDALFTCLE
jgi:uroporphyrinogen-III synthase